MDNAAAEARPQPLATTGVQTIGQMFRGLDATPTGSAAATDAVADFSGATVTRRASNMTAPLSTAGAEPWNHTPSQTAGSIFVPDVSSSRGLWLVQAQVAVASAAGAVAIAAALSVDGVAADLDAATAPVLPDGNTVPDAAAVAFAAGAGSVQLIKLSGFVAVRQNDLPVVRLLITDDAGAAPPAAELVLTDCYIAFTFVRDVP